MAPSFVPYCAVKELQAEPNLRMELWPSTRVAYLILFFQGHVEERHQEPLANKKVRQALNYAINKQALITVTTQGLGKPLQILHVPRRRAEHHGRAALQLRHRQGQGAMAEAGFRPAGSSCPA